MTALLRPALVLFLILTAITGIAYPLVVTGLAQAIFPEQAAGSLVVSNGQAVGLYFASGSDSLGDPLRYGLASPAQTVEQALGITFSATA